MLRCPNAGAFLSGLVTESGPSDTVFLWGATAVWSKNAVLFGHKYPRLTEVDKPRFVLYELSLRCDPLGRRHTVLKRAHRFPPDLRHAVIGRLQASTDHHGLIELGQYGVALHASARTEGPRQDSNLESPLRRR